MLKRKRERNFNNFTYFFGGLSEEEQMYRDYYETDLEENPEDEALEDLLDEHEVLVTGEFDPKRFDFIETNLGLNENHENFEDMVEDKIFKFKYRKQADYGEVHDRREKRMLKRFFKRVESRDPAIEQDVHSMIQEGQLQNSLAARALGEEDRSHGTLWVDRQSKPIRDYMLAESVQQYKDYYESDAEEQRFFEFMDEMSQRDKIRFMEVFEDFTIEKRDLKKMVQIPKREYNPALSLIGNLALDLVDFRERVRPMARDLASQDISAQYQRMPRDQALKLAREVLET